MNGESCFLDSMNNNPEKDYPRIYRILKQNAKNDVFRFDRAIQFSHSTSCSLYFLVFAFLVSRSWLGSEILYLFPPLPDNERWKSDLKVASLCEVIYKIKNAENFILHLDFLMDRQEFDEKNQKIK